MIGNMLNKTYLLIDAGNSRIKWTVVDERFDVDEVENHTDLSSAIKAWKIFSKPDQVWLASVRDKHFNAELRSAIKSMWALPTREVTSAKQAMGVTNAYAEPEQLGCDRWAAMLAAFHERQSTLLVVNVGTALTIDAINTEGLHLGGLISPGIYLQQKALNAGTNINCFPEFDADNNIKLFSNTTAQGIESGTVYAVSALINKAYQELAKRNDILIVEGVGGLLILDIFR